MGIATVKSAEAVKFLRQYKNGYANVSEGIEIKNPWTPLKSHWTIQGHDRQAEIDHHNSFPSQYSKPLDKEI